MQGRATTVKVARVKIFSSCHVSHYQQTIIMPNQQDQDAGAVNLMYVNAVVEAA